MAAITLRNRSNSQALGQGLDPRLSRQAAGARVRILSQSREHYTAAHFCADLAFRKLRSDITINAELAEHAEPWLFIRPYLKLLNTSRLIRSGVRARYARAQARPGPISSAGLLGA